MKKPVIILSFALLSATAAAQNNVIRQQSCSNELIAHQADSIKQDLCQTRIHGCERSFRKHGKRIRNAGDRSLNTGSWYQFVFIGDKFKLYEVRMFDWNERQVVLPEENVGRCWWQCDQLFLHTTVLRIPHDETCAGKQEEERIMRLRDATQKQNNPILLLIRSL